MTTLGTLLIQARASTSTTSVPSTLRFQQRHSAAVLHPHRRFPSMSKALVHELDRKMQQMREYALVTHGYHNENFQYPVHVRRSHDGEKPHRTFPSNHSRLSRGHRLLKSPRLSSSAEETPSTTTTNHCPNHSNSNSKAKRSQKSSDLQHSIAQTTQTFVVPPNKTVNDIDPALLRDQSSYTTGPALTRLYLHRKSSSSSLTSSPNFNASRPHSIACLSTTETIASNTSDSNESCTTTTITSDTTLITMDNPDEPSSPLFNSSPSSSQSILNQSTGRTPIRTMTQKFFSKLFHHPSKS